MTEQQILDLIETKEKELAELYKLLDNEEIEEIEVEDDDTEDEIVEMTKEGEAYLRNWVAEKRAEKKRKREEEIQNILNSQTEEEIEEMRRKYQRR